MVRFGIALFSAIMACLAATPGLAQTWSRQPDPVVTGAPRLPAQRGAPALRSTALSGAQRNLAAQQLTGTPSASAGAPVRYGLAAALPQGGSIAINGAEVVYEDQGAWLNSAVGNPSVLIDLPQTTGSALFDCAVTGDVIWRTQSPTNSAQWTQGSAPLQGDRVMFVVNLAAATNGAVYLAPAQGYLAFLHCDVSMLN